MNSALKDANLIKANVPVAIYLVYKYVLHLKKQEAYDACTFCRKRLCRFAYDLIIESYFF
jgi:hypothetical protein